jgi:chlorobactene glucosyltransferase
MILLFVVSLIILATTAIVIYNFFSAPLLRNSQLSESPFVSVLIPARNEEKNIALCIKNILQQNYSNYEIIIVDDESTDDTLKIIRTFSANNNRIIIISGKNLPEGWKGKNWACHQLSENASGDLLLFIDADVRISPDTLTKCISVYNERECSLLTIFPTQRIYSPGEFLIVPLMNWLLLTLLPLKYVYTTKRSSFTAANGQFMLWDKKIYNKIGGHKIVSDKIVEDMELARLVKKNGYKVLTSLGDNNIFCRMYSSFSEGYKGFSKNFYPGFNTSPVLFLMLIFFLFLIYTIPFIYIFFKPLFIVPAALIIIQRILISIKSKQNILINIFLHLVQMFIMLLTGINSVIASLQKKLYWKGRRI